MPSSSWWRPHKRRPVWCRQAAESALPISLQCLFLACSSSPAGCCAGQSPQANDPSPFQWLSISAQGGRCRNNPHRLWGWGKWQPTQVGWVSCLHPRWLRQTRLRPSINLPCPHCLVLFLGLLPNLSPAATPSGAPPAFGTPPHYGDMSAR